MSRPSPLNTGPSWYQDRDKEILDYVDSIKPVSGIATMVVDVPGGRAINANPAGTSGGSVATPLPWDLTIVISGTASVNIRAGSINGFIPGNMFNTFVVSASGTIYVKLSCSTDGAVVTAVTLNLDSTPAVVQTPVNSALPMSFEYTIGIISDGVGFNLAGKLLTATGSRLFLADKSSPAGPGEMAFVEWLVWAIA